ncbi:hypothetical protein [Butyrivibrio sp. NC2002]|uniref:hypothetical protein n=1 Tax=Butyrivibrio sp. NC2002 TaxID=1410610 RepID=UPI00056B423A|nr:hypothetical protein [Butyrivibrio sp. NC2002]
MDKTEYKIRADEIKNLMREHRFEEAVRIADTIDWKRVKSVGMLCAISDLYKVNRRLEESRDILLLAYDRSPTRREIVYSLCELAIAMGEFVQAIEYYKEFVRLAPRNTARYILQYKLYEAQEVSLEERIAVLEEYKKHDYNEKWAYELAYLYHRVGLTTECIEECDELFLYMREGRYVIKALELKALHEPLSPEQKAVYQKYKAEVSGRLNAPEPEKATRGVDMPLSGKTPTKEIPPIPENFEAGDLAKESADNSYQTTQYYNDEEPAQDGASDYEVPTVNVNNYNTMDLQKEIAANLKEVLNNSPEAALFADANGPSVEDDTAYEDQPSFATESTGEFAAEATAETGDIAYAAGSVIADDTTNATDTGSMAESYEIPQEDNAAQATQSAEDTEAYLQDESSKETEAELPEDIHDADTKVWGVQEIRMGVEAAKKSIDALKEAKEAEEKASTVKEEIKAPKTPLSAELKDKEIVADLAQSTMNEHAMYKGAVFMDEPLQDEVPGAVIRPNARYQINSHFDKMLSQEYDGQISMAIDEKKQVDDQITGQISISEFMKDWESFKQSQKEKQLRNVKKLVASETGELFKDFDENLTEPLLNEEPDDEIRAALDLQNTTSMVQLTGSDLDLAQTVDSSEQEEEWASNSEEAVDVSEPAQELQPEIDLGETADIDAEAVEKKLASEDNKSEEETEAETDIKEDTDDSEDVEDVDDKETAEDESKEASEESSEEEITTDESEDEAKAADTKIKEEKKKVPSEEDEDSEEDKGMEDRVRVMTPEEKELFGPYIHHRKSRKQIIEAIDNLSMAAYTNNAIVTGEEGAGTVNLAKGLIKAAQATDSNFSGKVAMISAITLNKRTVSPIFDKIVNGALIIRRAADLKEATVKTLLKLLQNENKGYIVVIEDTKDDIDRLLDKYPELKKCFNVRVDIEALDDDSLVAYAKQYAIEKEHVIDNLGILALHQKIAERQTLDHEVTVKEVRDMVDDAIYYANKRSIGHVVDVLLRKRFNEEDMIILREKDFLH